MSKSFEDFMTRMVKGPNILPEGCFIANDGRYAGISWSDRIEKEPNVLWQTITGVLREYRGRGIAITLKLRVIDFAARDGYDVIKTWNSSANDAMLGINRKLGFGRHVGWITFEKLLN
jgi:predicted GNAT superfamily acetyltransferase